MTKNLSTPLVILGVLLFITACGGSHEPNTPPENLGDLASGQICYSSACATTTAVADIFDSGKEYIYPDYQKFPTASMREQYRAPIAFLDLRNQSLHVKVSKDFMLDEFVQPEKGRYGILLPITVKSAQAIRDALGGPVKITSGYRSPGYNAATDGSATWSRHTYGDAIDMQFSSLKSLEQECTKKNASFVLAYTAHIHCDWREVKLDPAFYPPAKDNGTGPALSAAFVQLSHAYSAQTAILQTENTLTISLPEEIENDLEGVPLYRWKVTTPAGEILTFETPEVELPNTMHGTYKVEAVVGEMLHASAIIIW